MFIQLFLNANNFVMVNYNHIVMLEPSRNGSGTSVTLVTGSAFTVTDPHAAILESIADAKSLN